MRQLVDETIDPATKRIILKIVKFYACEAACNFICTQTKTFKSDKDKICLQQGEA